MFQLFAMEVKKLQKLLIEILIEILIEMTKIITFLIKTIRNLRTNIYSFVCVTKNIALTNEVVGRLRHCYFCELVWVIHVTSLSAGCQNPL